MKLKGLRKIASNIYRILTNTETRFLFLSILKWPEDLSIGTDANFLTQICINISSATLETHIYILYSLRVLDRTQYTGDR